MGAPRCVYRIRWGTERESAEGSPEQIAALQHQLDATKERLWSVFAAASDLIAADDLDDVLARITARAALEVRAIRYLLAVKVGPAGELHCHHKGFEDEGVAEYVDELLHRGAPTHPDSWLVVPVRSNRREYGRLLALRGTGQSFLAQERELFEVYAHYAATALDAASALIEARRRSEQSSALLSLARALAAAGTSTEIARRLAAAVPLVVDCDRVGVYLWDAARGELVRRAVTTREAPEGEAIEDTGWVPTPGGPLHRMLADPRHEPLFVDKHTGDPRLRDAISRAREEIHPVTLLYMDLDGFKPVNDEFGHDIGDQLLVAVAKRLAACTRVEDTVARLGGDEFAVLVDSGTAPADAEQVSDRLAAAVTRPFVIGGHQLHLGASIGRAVFPIDADDPDGLLRAADAAMFGVKRDTRARKLDAERTR